MIIYFAGKITRSDWRSQILSSDCMGAEEDKLFDPSHVVSIGDGFFTAGLHSSWPSSRGRSRSKRLRTIDPAQDTRRQLREDR